MMQSNNGYEVFQGKIVCPRCHGNGLIYMAKISGFDHILYTCDECEACWKDVSSISLDSFSVLGELLDEMGRTYKEVTDLGYYMVE